VLKLRQLFFLLFHDGICFIRPDKGATVARVDKSITEIMENSVRLPVPFKVELGVDATRGTETSLHRPRLTVPGPGFCGFRCVTGRLLRESCQPQASIPRSFQVPMILVGPFRSVPTHLGSSEPRTKYGQHCTIDFCILSCEISRGTATGE
jgi:hypothetical protein